MNRPVVAIDARLIGRQSTGDTSYWTGLVRGLMGLESDTEYLLFSNAPRPEEIPEHPRFHWISVESRRDRWWSLFRFPLAARRRGAKVIHVQYNLSPLVATGGVTTVHDLSFYADPAWFKPRDRVLLQRFVPPSCRRACKVLTVSEFSKGEIRRWIGLENEKIVVTPNACGPLVQRQDPTLAAEKLRAALGIDTPFLLTVGTRWPRKNMGLAIAAAAALPPSIPHKLIITGKAGWGDEEHNDRTHFTGFVTQDQLNALYSVADLYLAPALYEGFGITLLEAYRCGCPVLASPADAHKEIAGSAAQIAPSFKPEDWTPRIEDLLTGDSSKLLTMRQLGFKQEERFSWSNSAAITEGVYREVAAMQR